MNLQNKIFNKVKVLNNSSNYIQTFGIFEEIISFELWEFGKVSSYNIEILDTIKKDLVIESNDKINQLFIDSGFDYVLKNDKFILKNILEGLHMFCVHYNNPGEKEKVTYFYTLEGVLEFTKDTDRTITVINNYFNFMYSSEFLVELGFDNYNVY